MVQENRGYPEQLVLGIGNLLLGDEGVGVHAAQMLMSEALPEGTRVLDTGTAVLDAMDALAAAERVIVMDAMQANGTPGSIYRIALKDCKQAGNIGSLHGFDIGRVMALSGRTDMPDVIVIGMEPARIEWSVELSPEVSGMFAPYLDMVRQEIDLAYPSVSTLKS